MAAGKRKSLQQPLFITIASQRARALLSRLDTHVRDIWQRFNLPNAKSPA